MNSFSLIKKNLAFYWRTGVGVVLGAAVSTAALTGALLVGSSVRYSLNDLAHKRLGSTRVALAGGKHTFRAALADDVSVELSAAVAPVLHLKGVLILPATQQRINRVQVYGVDERFWEMGEAENPLHVNGNVNEDEIVLNRALARALGIDIGDELLLRVEKPHAMHGEAPLSLDKELSTTLRLTTGSVVTDEGFGRFSLLVDQASPYNVFLPLEKLGRSVDVEGKANLLLVGAGAAGSVTIESADKALKRCFIPDDVGLIVRKVRGSGRTELRSSRVFLDAEVGRAAREAMPGAHGILTYFVNDLSVGQRHVPYSFVAAIGPLDPGKSTPPFMHQELASDEVMINQWLAQDLGARPGDELNMAFFVMGPGRRLEERKARFRISSVLPMQSKALDRELVPDFPGLAKSKSCREWDPGTEIDLSRIRDRDEEYWEKYRGTPKAIITLEAGQELWGGRFGSLTAVRCPLAEGEGSKQRPSLQRIEEALRRELAPASMGLFFRPVRRQAHLAGSQALDFGPLFLGLSFFLVAAALVLMGLLFSLGVDQRKRETGVLLALGFTRRRAGRLLLFEGVVLAGAGALLGVAGAVCYTWFLIRGLATFWSDAVAGAAVQLHVEWLTLAVGGACGVCMAVAAVWVTLKRQARHEVRVMLDNDAGFDPLVKGRSARKPGFLLAGAAALGAATVVAWSVLDGAAGDGSGAAAFFSAGVLLLVSGLALTHGLLSRGAAVSFKAAFSLAGLGMLNASRRRSRSLGVTAMLACGTFLVFAVGANRRNPLEGAEERASGTGGFVIAGESSLPVLHGLDTEKARAALGVDEDAMRGTHVVNLRVRDGDDASCLNLNRAQQPRLLGVVPEKFQQRESFTFVQTMEGMGRENPWLLLNRELPNGMVPAVADQATIVWGLNRKVGDIIEYIDEEGRPFSIKLVAALKSSIFQGSLIISENRFSGCFPSEEGYRLFLVDAPLGKQDHVSSALRRGARNVGLDVKRTRDRLAALYAVESTYLSMFQVLGGLGLLLGSMGLALVLFRNVEERRGELALLQAVGFSSARLGRLLFLEHGRLLITGTFCGAAAAGVAVWPALNSLGTDVPWVSLVLTLAAILAGSFFWIWLAAKWSAKMNFLHALRCE